MKAIASGKHVLCDKPLENVDLVGLGQSCPSECLFKVREWVAACEKANLVFMDGMMQRSVASPAEPLGHS
jgi:hypothetical protein